MLSINVPLLLCTSVTVSSLSSAKFYLKLGDECSSVILKELLEMQHFLTNFLVYWDFSRSGFRRLYRKVAKSEYELRHVCMPVCPNGKTGLSFD